MRLDLTEARVQVSGGRGRRGPARERERDRDREQHSGRPRAPLGPATAEPTPG